MTKYGWRDNSLTSKDLTVLNDLAIEGDMSFGDARTDTFTCEGAAVFSDTLDVAGTATLTGDCNITGDVGLGSRILVTDSADGGASNGSILKKQLAAGEAYTGTTAGTMVKMYGEATATVPSGEFCAVYASLKGLHTDPGNNTSIISAHVHASNTTVVHAGVWLYGDMTNGFKMSGSTLTNALDLSQATAVTNVLALPALSTAPVSGQTTADYTFTKYAKLAITIGGATYYLIADTTA